ncbi:response regulator transcription factor [Cellulophaga baltica]|uniref:response regulator transcription factor n=1 Tax=Cellulophaga baltica TaxID=76594 RepID=UPI0015F5A681|nr:response regulator transcription factor [Cellulophaga baltica]MBA6313272.1 response regulator transcription factor [Cellulophaga baltica]
MHNKIKIVYAEDELSLGKIVKESLESRDFNVYHCADGYSALATYHEVSPDILVLDIMMPKKDGFTLAKEIRLENKQIPIIFLTAKSQTKDVVEGFELGGNDYLKKPFSMEELIVRIHSLLERQKRNKSLDCIPINTYNFNYIKQTPIRQDEIVKLTHREAELLFHLCEKRNEILDRTYVLNKIWGDDDFFNARSMDVFITKLRKKLIKDKNVQILNVRGFGYKLVCS